MDPGINNIERQSRVSEICTELRRYELPLLIEAATAGPGLHHTAIGSGTARIKGFAACTIDDFIKSAALALQRPLLIEARAVSPLANSATIRSPADAIEVFSARDAGQSGEAAGVGKHPALIVARAVSPLRNIRSIH